MKALKMQHWRSSTPGRTKTLQTLSSMRQVTRFCTTTTQQKSWRKIFEDEALKKSIGSQDWYQLDTRTFDEQTNVLLKKEFKGSLYRALSTLFPEMEWHPWKFQSRNNQIPSQYWNSKENQRKYFDWLGKELGVNSLSDWYQKLSAVVMKQKGGVGLLDYFKGSPSSALMAAYPEHNWIPWKFNSVQDGFWKSIENQKKYFDWLGEELGVKQLDDWYQKLSAATLKEHAGSRLLAIHKGSPLSALMAAYPEHKWIPWKFNSVPSGFWNSSDNVKDFLSELSEKLSIQTLDDWYRVDWVHLKQLGATQLLFKYNGLYNLLKEQYPNHPWDEKRFQQGGGKKGQRWLAVTLKKMFPNEGMVANPGFADKTEILEDYMHPKAVFPSSKRPMQLDVFIPSRSLAFEYQGIQHYEEVGVFNPTKTYQQRDEEKRNLCAANNIKLIEVPYWWNRTQESLQEMIQEANK